MNKVIKILFTLVVCFSVAIPAEARQILNLENNALQTVSVSKVKPEQALAHDGWAHYVITADQTLWTLPDYFNYGIPEKTLENVSSVIANENAAFAIRTDGTLCSWSNAAFFASEPTVIMENIL